MITVAEVLAYLDSVGSSWPEADVQDAFDVEVAAQANRCRIDDPYPPDLGQAVMRRVQANLARRLLPLGVQVGDADSTPVRPSMLDAEVRRLEGPYRKLPMG